MKKLLAGAVSTAMFLSAVLPALATSGNVAIVKNNDVNVIAGSGGNLLMGESKAKGVAVHHSSTSVTGGGVSQSVSTGPSTATGKQAIIANVDLCDCDGSGFNLAVVKRNDVNVGAISGDNLLMGESKAKGVAVHHSSTSVTGGGVSQSVSTGPSTATGKQLIVVNVSGGWGH